MSKLRSVNTGFWSDPFIEDLSPSEKLLFLYLITNEKTNMLGIYEASLKKISFETGINKETVLKALKGFERIGKVKYINNYIILVNYMKHQKYNTNMKKSAIKVFNELPKELNNNNLVLDVNNPSEAFETLLNHFGMVRKIEVKVEDKIEDEDEEEINDLFDTFWNQFHYYTKKPKTDKEPTLKYWKKLSNNEKEKAIDKIEEYSKTNQPKYLKKARTYLADKTFNDEFIINSETQINNLDISILNS